MHERAIHQSLFFSFRKASNSTCFSVAARLRVFDLKSNSNFDCFSASYAISSLSFLSSAIAFSNRSFFWVKAKISLSIYSSCWLVLFLSSSFFLSAIFWAYARCEFLALTSSSLVMDLCLDCNYSLCDQEQCVDQ